MSQRFRNFGSLLLYSVTGLGGIVIALWLSGSMGGKAFSQTPPPPPAAPQDSNAQPPSAQPAVNPPAQTGAGAPPVAPPAPAAPPASVGVQQTGTQILTIFPEVKGRAKPPASPGETKIPDLLVGIIEDYNYNPVGKRDPFTPFERSTNTSTMGPIWPLQKYDLEQLKLVGVIWEVKIPKAMILDPSGKGYVVTVNERIGRNNGYIARIREGEIVVVENVLGSDGKATYVTKLMKLNPQ